MAYINKIVVNGQEVNANQLEGIQDKNGHARFIEGTISLTNQATGVTLEYGKWSLSGSHLMLVVAGYIEGVVSLSSITFAMANDLPSWIRDKVYPIKPNSEFVYELTTNFVNNAWDRDEHKFYLGKDVNTLYIQSQDTISVDADETQYFRIQFDLVIDNA